MLLEWHVFPLQLMEMQTIPSWAWAQTLFASAFSSRWGSPQSRLVSSRRCTASLFVWRCRESYEQNYRALPSAAFSCPAVGLVHPGTLGSTLFLNSVRTPGSPRASPSWGTADTPRGKVGNYKLPILCFLYFLCFTVFFLTLVNCCLIDFVWFFFIG